MGRNRNFGLAIIACLLLTAQSFAQSVASAHAQWLVREKFEYRTSIFLLESKNTSPEGAIQRLRVLTPGKTEFEYQSDGWSDFKLAFLKGERYYSAKSLVSSLLVLAVPASSKANSKLLFLLMAGPTGSSPGRLDVFAFDSSGNFSVLMAKDELHLERIVDLDGDGDRELVVSPCFHQFVGPRLTTYDPFHVYKLSLRSAKSSLSLMLTKKYNLEHYAGWAGPDCSEKLVVQTVPNGKPRIRRLKDIDEGR